VRAADWKVVGGTIVGTLPTVVRVPLSFDRRTAVELEISPEPESIIESQPESTETRSVSVSVTRAHFRLR
jgi:hypothetical protein